MGAKSTKIATKQSSDPNIGNRHKVTIPFPFIYGNKKENGPNGIPIWNIDGIDAISQCFDQKINHQNPNSYQRATLNDAHWSITNNNSLTIVPNLDKLYLKDDNIRTTIENNMSDEEKHLYGSDYVEKELRNLELKKLLFNKKVIAPPASNPARRSQSFFDYDGQERRKQELETLKEIIDNLFESYGYTFEVTQKLDTHSNHSNIRLLSTFPFSSLLVLQISLTQINFKEPFSEFMLKNDSVKYLELRVRDIVSQATGVPLEEVVFLQINNTLSCLVAFNMNWLTIPLNETQLYWEQIKKYIYQNLGAKTQLAEVNLRQNFIISKYDYDPEGDKEFDYDEGDTQLRGGRDYKQPNNYWKRIGLKIYDLFENTDWIKMDGNPEEWAIGYHGPICVAKGKETGNSGRILKYENGKYIPQPVKVPSGIYLAQDVENCFFMEEVNGKMYHIAIQCRYHPEHGVVPNSNKGLIVVDSPVYVRPCGIVIKEVK